MINNCQQKSSYISLIEELTVAQKTLQEAKNTYDTIKAKAEKS